MRNLPNVYSSYCPGAPVLNGTPGSMLEVLRTCLVNGTAKVSFNNIVVLNGIATIKAVTEGQVYFNGSRIAIEGCDEPLLNVTVEVDSHTAQTFSFKTTVADGTYGGSIKINQPGAGWQILFSGTNEAVFISGNLDSLGVCVKVTDVNAYYTNLDFYENMTSLTAGVGKADIAGMFDNTRMSRIAKSGFANANPIAWWLIADNTNVHFANDRIDLGTTTPPLDFFLGGMPVSWGQFESFADADKKNFFYSGPKVLSTTTSGAYDSTYVAGLGYFFNTTPGDANTQAIVLTDTMRNSRGWMKLYVSSCPNPYFNSTMVSGGTRGIRPSYKLNPNYLYSDYIFVANGPQRGAMLDSLMVGTIKETKFISSSSWGQSKNFGIQTFNGKRYVCVPIYMYYYTRPNASIDYTSLGVMPFLIGEKWGD